MESGDVDAFRARTPVGDPQRAAPSAWRRAAGRPTDLERYLRNARETLIGGLSVSVPNGPRAPAGCVGAD